MADPSEHVEEEIAGIRRVRRTLEVVDVESWSEFEATIDRIKRQTDELGAPFRYSPLLFRGQPDSSWTLETTLDRYVTLPLSMAEYFRVMERIRISMETFTNERWNFDLTAARNWCKLMPQGTIPGYEYMAFLRHHGFPSPLLDWSASCPVAAFFAFRERRPGTERVSIYVYCDSASGMKAYSSDRPSIYTYGPNVRTHQRHLLQQSHYTICTIFDGEGMRFAKHDDINNSHGAKGQDLLWKINIPSRERGKVLSMLHQYNLHAFSLFSSTESLAEKLAFEHLGPLNIPDL